MSDLKAQIDELEALQYIYSNEEFIINADDEEPGGQFFAHLDLPSNFNVVAKRLPYQRGSNSFEESFNIEHLPPIVLYATLPHNYPSEAMPKYLVSCKWLLHGKLSAICHHLDKLWEENKGRKILFIWTQFLKEEILQFLHITSTLDVSIIYTKQINYLKREEQDQELRLMQIQESQKRKREIEAITNPWQSSDAKGRQATQVKAQRVPLYMRAPYQQAPGNRDQMRPSSSTRKYDSDKEHFNQGTSQWAQSDELHQDSLLCSLSMRHKSRLDYPILEGSKATDLTGPKGHKKLRKRLKLERTIDISFLQWDSRTIFDLPKTEPICLALHQFDKQQAQAKFDRTSQECTVCCSSKPGSDCIKLDECGHIFCCRCIRDHFEVQIRELRTPYLWCLAYECNTIITPLQASGAINFMRFAKHDADTTQTHSDLMEDMEAEDDMAHSPSSEYEFPHRLQGALARCGTLQVGFW